MKKHFIPGIIMMMIGFSAFCQSKIPAIDKSPMDMSYYPPNYPILKIQDKITEPLVVRVTYSRPQRSGRPVFGELVEYEKVWRLGANEATEIEFFKDVNFAGKPVPKGKYTLYAIPSPDKWVVIINKETDTWGSFKYDIKKDLVRVEVPVEKLDDAMESLSIFFEKTQTGLTLSASWENIAVNIPITITEKPPVKTQAKPIKKKVS